MKKQIVSSLAVAALGLLGAAAVFAGQAPRSGINGSMHDLTYMAQAGGFYNQDDFQRVCIFCHTPHNAQPQGDVPAPLWNHEQSTVDLAPYTWAAPANLPIDIDVDPLIGPSRLCMGCHDGVTAADKHGPSVGTAEGTAAYKALPGHAMSAPGKVINDLTVTHPIGFVYDDAVAARNVGGDLELVDQSQFFLADVPDGAANDTNTRAGWTYNPSKKISDTLYSGYVTCASCHEVHNSKNAVNEAAINGGGYTPNYLVWAKEKNSALCLSCHIK